RCQPAFAMDWLTFGGWHDGATWTLRGSAEPMAGELAILSGDPDAYRAYAASYFEKRIPRDAIVHVLAGRKLDAQWVARITMERTVEDVKPDLDEIGYGA